MKKWLFFLLIFNLLLTACNEEVKKTVVLSTEDKKKIEEFATALLISFNNHEFELIRSSWDNEEFRNKVIQLLRPSEETVFNHLFDKEWSKHILYMNTDLVYRNKFHEGKAFLSNVEHFKSHSEITFSFLYEDYYVDFRKYRVKLINDNPKLVDFYTFKDNNWQSTSIKNAVRLNTTYTIHTKERKQANLYSNKSRDCLMARDTLCALENLYKIPESHQIDLQISTQKINFAFILGEDIFQEVLYKEYLSNQSPFIDYLYYYFQDSSIELKKVYNNLSERTGERALIDSLRTGNYMWY
ncbi:MAG: hypothetical protein EA412_00285 [Chitinophagaceae bacterium]|nr:MAG: hypothetical protein EA412_00285 [Chitinophagaceae bacterium]